MRRRRLARWLAAALPLLAPAASAQAPPSTFPAPAPHEFETGQTQSRIFVRRVRVEGVRRLSRERLDEVTREYEGREIGASDLRQLVQRLTRLYVDSGFASSGVVAANPAIAAGELTVVAVEGAVSQVRFATPPKWARPELLARLLVPDAQAPLHVPTLQERIAWLRDTGVVDRINVEVVPLARLGESELVVDVEEPRPWAVRIDYDNFHSPTIGARRASTSLSHRNVSGWGDTFDARYGDTVGLSDAQVSYAAPLWRTPLRIGARWDRSDSLAISPAPFRALDIKALSTSTAAQVTYEVLSSSARELHAFVMRTWRRSETTLLGIPFSFVPGIADGRSRVEAWRAGFNYSQRDAKSVLFGRVQASAGTTNVVDNGLSEGLPAERFRTIQVQLQNARRLPWADMQLTVRMEGQYTRDVLLPLERYSLGGAATLRGYRESLVLRDRAVLSSVELQVPLTRPQSTWSVAAVAFMDAAWSANVSGAPEAIPKVLASAGAGLLVSGPAGLSLRSYFAFPSKRGLTPRDDLQDRGMHFIVSWEPSRRWK